MFKVILAVGLWVGIGGYLQWRAGVAAGERMGALVRSVFWPFFLASSAKVEEPAVLVAVRAAQARIESRLARLEAHRRRLGADADPQALAVLETALQRAQLAHAQARGALELATVRLLVLEAEGDRAGVEALLADLEATVLALEEVG
jgi:hypothetical protein